MIRRICDRQECEKAIADFEKTCILICDKEGKIGTNPGELGSPEGVTFINNDEILVAGQANHRGQQFNVHSEQNFVNSFGRQRTEDGNFTYTTTVCVDNEGHIGRDPFNQNFRKFRSKTQWIGSVQPETFRKNRSTF